MLLVIIPDYHLSEEYDLDFYKKADLYLHDNPCTTLIEGRTLSDLRTAVEAILTDIVVNINTEVDDRESLEEMMKDPSTYMAIHFGIAL